jgi:putative OPT family oligopeptide transporter
LTQRELTLRGLILGAAITLVFTAANVYLGLKVGLTFASSIPAAVISMAVLRAVKNATIVENNIVQTLASAAGTLSSVIFVLPGLVMVGWWSGFPFWETFGVCAAGGILGVMYSVPLRRALVVQSTLPYPEGVAAAEVLKIGAQDSKEAGAGGLRALVAGSLASFGFAAVVASQLFAGEIDGYRRIGPATTGIGFALSLALVGAGHLIGLSVGIAILAGLAIAWGIATPILTALHPLATGDAATVATTVWAHQVRFIGAGAIGVAALWTIGQLVKPVVLGLKSSLESSRNAARGIELPLTERDLPINLVGLISVVSLVPVAILFAAFLHGAVPASLTAALVAGGVAYVVVAGFAVAAACGYMAGLIGSSNSPVSGLAILAVIGASLLLLALAGANVATLGHALVAYSLFVTAILLCVATIANDNLQDLKTGQLVGATPWKQQVALLAGVIVGSLVIPPILNLLARAYGFPGAPAPGMQPLAAPQATLISALAKGVIQGQIDWRLIGTGAIVGAFIVAIDQLLRVGGRFRLPPLAVGLGIYLPAATTTPVVAGAVAGWYFNRWAARQRDAGAAAQLGVLVASGFIVGESLFGVLLAGLIVGSGRPAPLALVGDWFATPALFIGGIAFVVVVAAMYRMAARIYARSSA